MKIAIIKYNAGNLMSVEFALQRLGVDYIITNNHEIIKGADKVLFSGVGEASTTMAYLKERKLDILIKDLSQPVFGICLGLQLMCSFSEEGNTECIGIFPEKVKKFEPVLKVPHMGWNTITDVKSKLFSKELENQYVYFVHSYYIEKSQNTIATTDYIIPFSSALNIRNFYGTQFHPEKSGEVGSKILKNFVDL